MNISIIVVDKGGGVYGSGATAESLLLLMMMTMCTPLSQLAKHTIIWIYSFFFVPTVPPPPDV